MLRGGLSQGPAGETHDQGREKEKPGKTQAERRFHRIHYAPCPGSSSGLQGLSLHLGVNRELFVAAGLAA
jgi:hypothetical protein